MKKIIVIVLLGVISYFVYAGLKERRGYFINLSGHLNEVTIKTRGDSVYISFPKKYEYEMSEVDSTSVYFNWWYYEQYE